MVQRFLHVLVVLGFLISPALAKPGDVKQEDSEKVSTPPKGQRVFYASHSLMWYVPPTLGELVAAAHIEGHTLVGLQKIGGSRTLQHWELPDGQNDAKKALNAGEVDVLVMSPIQFPDQGVENYIKLGLAKNPNMHFIVQISWGGGDTDNQDFPKGAWDKVDHNKTPDQIQKLYIRNIRAAEIQADDLNKKYGKGKKVVTLAPTAHAMVLLRVKIYNKTMPGLQNQNELFVDAAHPSAPMEALNSYVHYAVLYGQSPVGLPLPEVLKKAKRDDWNEQFNRAMQEIAWEAVTKYSKYSGVADPEPKKK